MKNLLPPSIRDAHYEALADVAGEVITIDGGVAALVPLLIDTAPSQALTHLAEFFSILGAEGWEYTTTEAEKRALLKEAIARHRYKGTPWAVRTAVNKAGFATVIIEEGAANFTHRVASLDYAVPLFYDGAAFFDGMFDYGSGTDGNPRLQLDAAAIEWALFRVAILLNDNEPVTEAIVERVRRVIAAYKNARSWLTDIGFVVGLTETLTTDETFAAFSMLETPQEFFDWAANYDGEYAFDGYIPYGSTNALTDMPDALLETWSFYDGAYAFDDALEYSGVLGVARIHFPVHSALEIAETLTTSDTTDILINP